MSAQRTAEIIDRVIAVLVEVKSQALELEAQAPMINPETVAAASNDPDPFARVFGAERGVYFRNRLDEIEEAVKELRAKLAELRREKRL